MWFVSRNTGDGIVFMRSFYFIFQEGCYDGGRKPMVAYIIAAAIRAEAEKKGQV